MNEKLKDYKEEVTAKLVSALEQGTVPWRKPWTSSVPFNAVSGRPYNGINTVVLMMRGLELDDGADPRWATYLQAQEKGWQIKKGAKGTRVTLWKNLVLPPEQEDQEGKTIMMHKLFTVFHASQIEGIGEYQPAIKNELESNETAERLMLNSGAEIRHGGCKACYYPSEDYIMLPDKRDFHSASGYYATALHELIHWTGHKTRLNRDLTGEKRSKSYAKEELLAELGSMFLSRIAGIKQDEEVYSNHASYISSWLKCLKEDVNFVFKVSAEASRAAEFLRDQKGAD